MPQYTIMMKRGTTSDWASLNPILREGEPGLESDTNLIKVGDGLRRWVNLPYVGQSDIVPIDPAQPSEPISDASLQAHVLSETPHPVYDDGPSLVLLYQNAKV